MADTCNKHLPRENALGAMCGFDHSKTNYSRIVGPTIGGSGGGLRHDYGLYRSRVAFVELLMEWSSCGL